MEMLSQGEYRKVMLALAQEFLVSRLGIQPSQRRVRRLAAHLILFEREINRLSL